MFTRPGSRSSVNASQVECSAGYLTIAWPEGSGTLRTSLFAAVDEAKLPDEVAMQFIDIFGADIDFHRGLHRGDRFRVVYEMLEADGEPMRGGRVLSADFVNAGRLHQAVWYQEPGKPNGGYFGFDGKSLSRSFLASPMEVSRVTSGFKMRLHPILNTWRAHTGVDYGAPTGTPVWSVADGQVREAGWKGACGRAVVVQHRNGLETMYCHLSSVAVSSGKPVSQKQVIGYVGTTGRSTGPHLHFAVRRDGHFVNPLKLQLPRDAPLAAR